MIHNSDITHTHTYITSKRPTLRNHTIHKYYIIIIHTAYLLDVANDISQLVFIVKPMSVVILGELLIVLSAGPGSMIYVDLFSVDD